LVLFCEETSGTGREEFLSRLEVPVVFVQTKLDVAASRSGREGQIAVSAVTGEGLGQLRRRLAQEAFGRLVGLGEVEPVVTRARHRTGLELAATELEAFHDARGRGVDAAATATHLRAAVGALDDLIGVVTPEDVLDRVFASFCVGK
jgi:tRNA modification GTPase